MKKLFISVALIVAAVIGEVRCIYQFFTSDFEPIGKREVFYGIAAVTGVGVVVGYFDIAD